MGFLDKKGTRANREAFKDDYDDEMWDAIRSGDEEKEKHYRQLIEEQENVIAGLDISIKDDEEREKDDD